MDAGPMTGYRRLFEEARFTSTAFYAPFPSLQYPERFVPLSASWPELTEGLAVVKPRGTIRGALWHAAARVGLLPRVIPNYVIVATR